MSAPPHKLREGAALVRASGPDAGELEAAGGGAPTVFDANPRAVMERTAELAKSLQDFVREQKLTVSFGAAEHLQVEAWQFIGMQIGVRAIPSDPVPVMAGDGAGGYVCRTDLVDRTGQLVGRGFGRCMRSEPNWRQAPEYAVESMAQTRSISKAFRNTYGFIAKAAGYDPAGGEEPASAAPAPKRTAAPAPPTAREDAGAGRVKVIELHGMIHRLGLDTAAKLPSLRNFFEQVGGEEPQKASAEAIREAIAALGADAAAKLERLLYAERDRQEAER